MTKLKFGSRLMYNLIRNCKFCGKEFYNTDLRVKYCCLKCFNQKIKLYKQNYYYKNSEKYREYNKVYYKNLKEKSKPT